MAFTGVSFGSKEDSKKFAFEQEDIGIRSDMEGGYVLTRPRHTRGPRRTWTTGFTDISQQQKAEMETFYATNGTFQAFSYTVPITNEIVNVRFKEPPKYEYLGFGANPRWNINDIKLEEV